MDFNAAGITLTVFFGGTLIMRVLGPLFLRRFASDFLFSVFGGVSAAFVLVMLFMESVPVMMVLIAIAGFLQGICSPAFVVMCTEAFPGRTASATSLFTFVANTGSLTAPVWMGGLAEYTGFRLPLVLVCFAMFAASILILLRIRNQKGIKAKAV